MRRLHLTTCAAALAVLALAACGEDVFDPPEGALADAGEGDARAGFADSARGDAPTPTDGGTTGTDAADSGDAAGAGGQDGDAVAIDSDLARADVAPGECSAAAKKKCNDGMPCTIDACAVVGGAAVCTWTFAKDACFIGGVCRKPGEPKPGSPCLQCLPEAATTTWSQAKDGAPCDDGDLCTYKGACMAKGCLSVPLACDDGVVCTADLCDPKVGCHYPPTVAGACNDGSACTTGDTCAGGTCGGKPVACDDKNPCTADACDLAKGCTHTDTSAACSDGNACTEADACQGGACKPGPSPNCDDGSSCTTDFCDVNAGCYHLPLQSPCCLGQTSICDDGNPCTNDDCDPKTSGCGHSHNTAACNDNNACTTSDTCKAGKCVGSTKVCNDANPCTADACAADKGCVFSPAGTATCDDGNPCTKGDVCQGGVCKGSGQCACTPTFSPQAVKFTSVAIGDGGHPGEGIDLDDNPKTCAPASDCSAGINNALGVLAGIANPPFDKAVKAGQVTFLIEFKDFKQGPVNLALYAGKVDPANATCDPAKATCTFVVDAKMIDPQKCLPLVGLPGQLAGTLLKAGGKGSNFPIAIPIQPGVTLPLTIYGARLEGTVALTPTGGVAGFDGILAGSVPKAQMLAAIDALPAEGLPLPKDGIKAIVDGAVTNDIDSDGNGSLDAASIALKVKGPLAKISGTY